MVKYAIVVFAGLAAALPLNINLGAYSPALVVGDGEISFGGRQDVSELITALEGAAVNAAAGAANRAAGEAAGNVAAAAVSPVPDAVEDPSADPVLTEQAQQIAGLQGLGKKTIAPRIGETEAGKLGKRDIAGFDRALTFAEAALTKGPKVELGTGAEGSGVGIIVEHHTPAAGGAAEKRDVSDDTGPRRRAKVTTMYIRRGLPASLQPPPSSAQATIPKKRSDPQAQAQGQAAPPMQVPVSASKRDSSSSSSAGAIDAVNLNVDGGAGVTMTFVEAFGDGDGDEEGDDDE